MEKCVYDDNSLCLCHISKWNNTHDTEKGKDRDRSNHELKWTYSIMHINLLSDTSALDISHFMVYLKNKVCKWNGYLIKDCVCVSLMLSFLSCKTAQNWSSDGLRTLKNAFPGSIHLIQQVLEQWKKKLSEENITQTCVTEVK